MNFRLLEKTDFEKGFLELLSQLTIVGEITKKEFMKRFQQVISNKNHRVYVLEQNNKIISCATLFIEPKFIHDCGFVGHVEDVVVDKLCRGQKLGKKIIDFLNSEAERLGCYKILLDCSDKNVGFYQKCLYNRNGAYMAKYLNPSITKEVQPFYKSAFKTIDNFCKNHYREIIIVNISLFAGYYLYKNYWETKKDED
jgi:glucosamine-phosphate N-acetyltransferase